MDEEDVRKRLAAFAAGSGIAEEALAKMWHQLAAVIEREYGNVQDTGIGLGQGDIDFAHDGLVFSLKITIKGAIVH